jgi:hypothetical protein
VREDIIFLIIGTVIITMGSSAVTAYIFRLRPIERVLGFAE